MMFKIFPSVFGAVVAYILLLLYTGTVIYMTKSVAQHGLSAAPKDEAGQSEAKPKKEFSPGVVYVVTTVGGLVSALVIAKLAVTTPGESPALVQAAEAEGGASEKTKKLFTFLTAAYLIGWLCTGLTALVVGVMLFPELNTTLGEIGTTWLGLAVAAGYAYFGISPTKD